MTEKIDYAAMRESVRKNYAEHPSNGDAVLAFEARNAELIADLCVTVVRECHERRTHPREVLQGLVALIATPLENLIHEYSMRPDQVLAFVTEGLESYLVRKDDVTPDAIVIPRRDVGGA